MNSFGLPPRVHQDDATRETAQAANRIDAVIAAFAIGMLLGWITKAMGAA
jgi:hypothetical protein